MVTVCEVVYVPAPGLKVGVAVTVPEEDVLPPHPAKTRTHESVIARTAGRRKIHFSRMRTVPPELFSSKPSHPKHTLLCKAEIEARGRARWDKRKSPRIGTVFRAHRFSTAESNLFCKEFVKVLERWREVNAHLRANAKACV